MLGRGARESAVVRAASHANRGIAYNNKHEHNRAIADLKQAIRLNPKFGFLHARLGDAYYGKSDWDGAIAEYNQAIRFDPTREAKQYWGRGAAYIEKGAYDRAIADLDQSIRMDAVIAISYYFRGDAYFHKNDYDRAIADFSESIRLEPQQAFVFAHRGRAYMMRAFRGGGDYGRAIKDLDEAIRLKPNSAFALGIRGFVFEQRGDVARARADYEAALAASPHDVVALGGVARLDALAATPIQPPTAPIPIAAAASCSSLEKRVALVVGNSAYAGAARLVNPTNDADDVSALLRDKLCFTVIEAKDATHETFSRRIGEFAEAASGADVALFYYAGHGAQFQNANYLLPVDSKMANEYDAIHGNISAQDMIATIETRAKATLVFLDACRDNPIEEDFRRRMASSGRGFGDTRGLAPMTGRSSETLVVFATRPNERAADGADRNSPFTEAFLEHMATPGKDIELVMRDVAASVRAKTNGRQIPQRFTELEHGLMLLPGR